MEDLELLRQRIQQLEKELSEVRQNYREGLHNLSLPLRPMKGFIRTLLDGLEGDWYTKADRREFYGIMEDTIDSLDHIVKGLNNALE